MNPDTHRHPDATGGTLLIVDDVPVNLKMLMSYLTSLDYKILVAEDGPGALEIAASAQPDLILLDVMMPKMDGFETCRQLKHRIETQDIPVIFMTGLGSTADKVAGFQAGGVDYVIKPVQYEEVLARIRTHLTLCRLQQRLAQQNQTLAQQNQALRETQQALQTTRDQFQHLYHYAPVGYLTTCANGEVLNANRTAADMLRTEAASLIGQSLDTLVHEADRGAFWACHGQVLRERHARCELRLLPREGDAFHVSIESIRIDNQGERHCRLAFSDISDRKQVEAQLRLSAQVIESTLEGVVITDDQTRIIAVNPSFVRTTGYSAEEAMGMTPKMLNSGHHDGDFYRRMWDSLQRTGHWQGEIWNRRKNGEIYPEWLNISAITDDQKRITNFVGVFSDISSQEEIRMKLHKLAYYDMLTDLPNRHLFTDRLEQALARAERNQTRVGLLFLDLDRFKLINDTLGHSIGDQLLKQAAKRLRDCVRGEDTVARMGGDEFTMILHNIKDITDSTKVASKILNALTDAFEIEGRQYYIGGSIGIAHYPDDGTDTETLLRNADGAMYQAKERGRNNFQVYHMDINRAVSERLELETALRRAIDNHEFRVVYQPQVDLRGGTVVGVEALVRWEHPSLGTVAPDRFIALAEETGLIVPLGYQVMETACREIVTLRDQVDTPLHLAVNLSPHQFLQPGLMHRVDEILRQTQLPPDLFELEITESAAMPNVPYTLRTLRELRDMGVHISVDDFGTGFSSLGHLKRLPINKLKIDRSFVQDIPTNPDDMAIASAIILMAHSLNLKVVAEGVENHTQMRFFRDKNCDYLQGFFLGQPTPLDTLPTQLEQLRQRCQVQRCEA